MGQRRYVQHISGHGEKWDVTERGDMWRTEQKFIVDDGCYQSAFLPKANYRLCEPPEQWEDVTAQCVFNKEEQIFHEYKPGSFGGNVVLGRGATCLFTGYRLRKVGNAFIVERKLS